MCLPKWEEWIGVEGQEEEDCIIIMPRLQKLVIHQCPKLKSLLDFLFKTSLREFQSLKCFVTWKGELQGVTIRQEEETTITLALLVRLYTLLMLNSKLWSIWIYQMDCYLMEFHNPKEDGLLSKGIPQSKGIPW
nr:hypothetical protein CFP56_67654 [Quercus suber]